MSKLFNISGEERERIKFLHETNNPHAVIVEQDYSRFGNEPANTKGDYGFVSKIVDKAGVKGRIARDKQRLQNIANMKKQATANKGMVTVAGKQMRWTD